MAAFKTHLTGGIITGLSLCSIGYFTIELNLPQAVSLIFTGSIGGLLPDLDHDSGKPLELLFSLISIVIPTLLLTQIIPPGNISPEILITYFLCCYLVINFPICSLIKKITVHRGIMHSIPFSILFAQTTYFLFNSSGQSFAAMTSLSIFTGCMTHLLLDEYHSLTFKFGIIPHLKRSAGSALKISSPNPFITAMTYGLIAGLGVILLAEIQPINNFPLKFW